ncbi:hypothetical protein RHSIM_Rhsim06G0113600 [Rhododendron simsii]|uniref:Uncharacterized protein n=1 Tax=Rhododendron simsii TaxID=118357 RepID=A0A834GZL2_RHOSS|nr:hypothetical protein RHSIM_Rhsim06G0113600 [Rhododendron simsii]
MRKNSARAHTLRGVRKRPRSGTPSRRPACGSAPSTPPPTPPPAPSATPRPRPTFPFCPSHPSLSPRYYYQLERSPVPSSKKKSLALTAVGKPQSVDWYQTKVLYGMESSHGGKPAYTSGNTVESSSGPRPSVLVRSTRAAQQQHRFKMRLRPEECRSNCVSSSTIVVRTISCRGFRNLEYFRLISTWGRRCSLSLSGLPISSLTFYFSLTRMRFCGRRYSVDSSPQDDRVPINNAAAQRQQPIYASGSVYLDNVTSSREMIGRGNGNEAERMMRGANRYPIGRNGYTEDESSDSVASFEF